jgi:hypothetical protein
MKKRRPVADRAAAQFDPGNAIFDPGSVFTSPEEVRDSSALSTEQKIDILRSWEYDAAELAVAEEEGMCGDDDDDLLRRVLLALDSVTDGIDVEHTGPTKQHGLPD